MASEINALKTPAETGLGELFGRLKGGFPGDVAVRAHAIAGFAERGLPHRRVEEFKYFDLQAIMREALPPAERPSAADLAKAFAAARAFAGVPAARLTVVNGHFAADLSEIAALPQGVTAVPLGEALAAGDPLLGAIGSIETARDNPIYQLNTAFMGDGFVIRVAPGARVEQPLLLRFVNSGETAFASATRVVIEVGEGASVTLVESHESDGALGYQTNGAMDLRVGDRASVEHVRLNAESPAALALSTLAVRIGAEASLRTINVVTGSAHARHQVFATFAGENATANVDGINLLNARQQADATLVVDHAVPHCTSREAFKTILDGQANGVFQGKIIVRPHAQKTDGAMKSDTLLLSDEASMNNKPELEIFADDVVCGHGATCGAPDEDLLFYLKSRGLPQAEAESLLLQAFVGPPIEAVAHEGLREALVGVVERWLAARR